MPIASYLSKNCDLKKVPANTQYHSTTSYFFNTLNSSSYSNIFTKLCHFTDMPPFISGTYGLFLSRVFGSSVSDTFLSLLQCYCPLLDPLHRLKRASINAISKRYDGIQAVILVEYNCDIRHLIHELRCLFLVYG